MVEVEDDASRMRQSACRRLGSQKKSERKRNSDPSFRQSLHVDMMAYFML